MKDDFANVAMNDTTALGVIGEPREASESAPSQTRRLNRCARPSIIVLLCF